jgi:hypothetical protein
MDEPVMIVNYDPQWHVYYDKTRRGRFIGKTGRADKSAVGAINRPLHYSIR